MKRLKPATALAALLATAALLPAAAGAADSLHNLPKLAPGLWEMKSTIAEMGGLGQSLQICIGEDGGDLAAQAAKASGECSRRDVSRNGSQIVLDAVCPVEGSTATVHATFSGDFNSRFTGDVRSTYSPPMHGLASTTMQQEARRLGPCAAGQKPGEVVRQGIHGINVDELLKKLPR
ncbi:DUF3617 family protein [Azoarcus indigens]|uniref:Uncharacterized protein DUF3617 n=1 Tax=Azoarcus indigens TaxID=29545 RepID=A0A4R6DPQ6_9RHOO|nr:DUF3617 family protein [Azoarcus indigens]NMG66837.1 DUF3617 family protein [Azoarcus indigens]TDN47005.1 uncharacterized protein DUF3617 [Azoarcus indigens]